MATSSVNATDEIYINPDNGTIKDSIDSINDSGTIHLADGNYNANKNMNNVNVSYNNKNITIIGQSRENTILDGENSNWLFNVSENGSLKLINLTLINFLGSGNTSDDAIIKNLGDDLYISNVIIKDSHPQVPSSSTRAYRPSVIYNSGNGFLLENTYFENTGGYSGSGRTVYNTGNYFTADNVTMINPNRYGLDNEGDYFTVKNSYLENTIPNATSSYVCCPIQSDANNILIHNIIVKNFPCCPIAFDGDNITVSSIKGYNNSQTINFAATNVIIKDSYFETNVDAAIAIVGGENVLIINNTFKNCKDSVIDNSPSATSDSPANNVTVKDCTFESSARAIKNAGNDFTVVNSNFTKNSGDYGAAIYNTGKNFQITGAIFKDNSADNGGAICQDDGSMKIQNSKFINNTGEDGSAIIIEMGAIEILNSLFDNNKANIGGTINVYGGKLTTSNVNFTNNKIPSGKNVYINIYDESENVYSTNLKITNISQNKEKITVQIIVTETNTGNALKNQQLSIKIGEKTLNGKTDSNGIATFTYTATNTIKLSVVANSKDLTVGSTKYLKSSASSSINVKALTNFKQVKKSLSKNGKNYVLTVQWKNSGTIKGSKTVTINLGKYKFVTAYYTNGKKVSLQSNKLKVKFTLPVYKSKNDIGTVKIVLKKK
jgi:hypothetical protein